MNTPVREGETIEGSRTMRTRQKWEDFFSGWRRPPPLRDPDKYMASCGPATWLLTTLNKDRHDTGVRWPCI